MSDDQFDPEDYEGVQPKMAQVPRAQVRKWEKQQRDLEAAQARLAEREREVAFARAGIPDDPRGAMFAKAYEGPVDDPSAIKAAWEQIFPSGNSPEIDEALRGSEAAAAAAAGASAPQGGVDHNAELMAIWQKHKADGRVGWETGARALAEYANQHFPDAIEEQRKFSGMRGT